jgi:probable HAF family extracellular repeat protein
MRLTSYIVALCAFLIASNTVCGVQDNRLSTTPGPAYTVVPLGMLPGGEQMFPSALSDTGFAVGFSQQQDDVNAAFYFHPAVGLVNASYDDASGTNLRDVNDLGEAVGQVITSINGEDGVYMYEFTPAEASATNLFGGYCEIQSNNNSGMYAGRAEGPDSPMQAFRFRPGYGYEVLNKPGMWSSSVGEINDRGVVLGSVTYTDFTALATVWDENGDATNIDIDGYNWSQGVAINDNNECLVIAGKPTGPQSFVVHSFVVIDGKSVDIGTLGGSSCSAEAINNAGVVVGSSYDQNGNKHGFVYRDGVITNLNLLVDRNQYHIDYAVDVNSAGVILAKANSSQAVLLVPINHH